jgi:hypothetical protein
MAKSIALAPLVQRCWPLLQQQLAKFGDELTGF